MRETQGVRKPSLAARCSATIWSRKRQHPYYSICKTLSTKKNEKQNNTSKQALPSPSLLASVKVLLGRYNLWQSASSHFSLHVLFEAVTHTQNTNAD